MPPSKKALELPLLTIADATAWSQWLTRHAATSPGVWLTLSKKPPKNCPHQPVTSLTYAQALDEALCHGWIDGQTRRHHTETNTTDSSAAALSQTSYTQRFTPRTLRSSWSARNVSHVTRLESENRMLPRGKEEVSKAKRDGRWDSAYSGSRDAIMPEIFEEAIRKEKDPARIRRNWEKLGKGKRYGFYHRLVTLRTEKGRERKVREFMVALGGEGGGGGGGRGMEEEGEEEEGGGEREGEEGDGEERKEEEEEKKDERVIRGKKGYNSTATTTGSGGKGKVSKFSSSSSPQVSMTDDDGTRRRRRSARLNRS